MPDTLQIGVGSVQCKLKGEAALGKTEHEIWVKGSEQKAGMWLRGVNTCDVAACCRNLSERVEMCISIKASQVRERNLVWTG